MSLDLTQKSDERRLFLRFSARFPAKFKDTREDYGDNLSLRNASAQGVKITTRERFNIKDIVTLEVNLPDEKDPMIIKGSVVWVRSKEPQLWDIGLRINHIDFMNFYRMYELVEDAQ